MADKGVVKCANCGKEVELEGGLYVWATKNPDKYKCSDCMASKTKSSGAAKKSTAKAKEDTRVPASEIKAEMFRKAYDEIMAAFSDIAEEVSPFVGGWVSTVVINRTKKF